MKHTSFLREEFLKENESRAFSAVVQKYGGVKNGGKLLSQNPLLYLFQGMGLEEYYVVLIARGGRAKCCKLNYWD